MTHPPLPSPLTVCTELETDAQLRDLLKRCPAPTFEAASAYRRTGRVEHVALVVRGIVARFVEPELRPRLEDPDDDVRLAEDLALDSLALLEIVLLAEEVLRISISAEEVRTLQTLGDVHRFAVAKVNGFPHSEPLR